MPRPDRPTVDTRAIADARESAPSSESDDPAAEAIAASEPGLAALPIAGLTRRRVAAILSSILVAWVIMLFARQVGDAQAATGRADGLVLTNAELGVKVAVLRRELDLIGRQRYVEQQARGYGLGTPGEIAFTLAADAPPLPADAPGSAAVRIGADRAEITPLERWLTVLFGPSD